jgi:hypothetical protein
VKKDSSTEDKHFVTFPWARAHILEAITVDAPHQDVALELLEFENGQRSLRFAAYSKGKLVDGPLVIHDEDLDRIAQAAGRSPSILEFLGRLAGGGKGR